MAKNIVLLRVKKSLFSFMRSLFILGICWLFALGGMAETVPHQLVVWAKDGSKQVFELSEKPRISFAGSDLVVRSPKMEVSYAVAQVLRFTYESEKITGVSPLVTGDTAFEHQGETLYFPHLPANSKISILTMAGKTMLSRTITVAGTYAVSLSDFETGTYLVRVNGITSKIVKR